MKRRCTPGFAAKHEITDEQVAYWRSLTDSEREHWFEESTANQRSAMYWERNGKLGQRHDQVEAMKDELHECRECGTEAPERYSVVAGDSAVCFPCCRQMGGIAAAMVPAVTPEETAALA